MKVTGRFGTTTRVSITGRGDDLRMVALTDGELLGQWYALEAKGFRVVELSDGYGEGEPGLALVHQSDLEEVLVIVPIRPDATEVDQLSSLLRAYRLSEMKIDGMKQ